MKTEFIILVIGSLVFLSHFFVTLFEKTRIPDVIWLTLIGFILGPVTGIVRPSDFGDVGLIVTKITLVVILFEGGLELKFGELKRFMPSAVLLTFTSYIVTAFLVFGFLHYISGFPFSQCLFYAAVLAGPAPSVVMPLLKKLRLSDSAKTILSLESTLGEAFCILISLGLLESLHSSANFQGSQVGVFFSDITISFAAAFAVGLLTGALWSYLLGKMRKLQNSLFTTPAFVFIVYGIAEASGFSGPIAVLSFGVTMGNLKFLVGRLYSGKMPFELKAHSISEMKFFAEIVFLLKIFFFVYLGLSIELTNWSWILMGLSLTLLLFIGRWLAMLPTQFALKINKQDKFVSSVMFPRGLAAAILAAVPLTMGFANSDQLKLVVEYTIIFSILLSSVLLFIIEKRAANSEPLEEKEGDGVLKKISEEKTEKIDLSGQQSSNSERGG